MRYQKSSIEKIRDNETHVGEAVSPSFSRRFIQASALNLSPTDIAWQNIMYKANDVVHFRFLDSSSASSNNEVLLLWPRLLWVSEFISWS
jgi:hypothetical protein